MPTITKTCVYCGQPFSGPRFAMKRRSFCCHECYAASRTQDLTGVRFGRLLVIEPTGDRRWRSICDCGNEAVSKTQSLTSGKAQSCGCLQREIASLLNKTHGASDTRAHNTWSGIIQRCTNPQTPQFEDYGGRGITVCEEWRDFANFLRDMGQPPPGRSIERRDNSLGYCKENCCWATRKEQQRNRRVNRLITYGGQTRCVTEWAEDAGIAASLLSRRLAAGWTFEEAVGIVPRVAAKRTGLVRPNARWVEHNGIRLIMADWCRRLGVNPKTVQSRLSRGASNLQALGLA